AGFTRELPFPPCPFPITLRRVHAVSRSCALRPPNQARQHRECPGDGQRADPPRRSACPGSALEIRENAPSPAPELRSAATACVLDVQMSCGGYRVGAVAPVESDLASADGTAAAKDSACPNLRQGQERPSVALWLLPARRRIGASDDS